MDSRIDYFSAGAGKPDVSGEAGPVRIGDAASAFLERLEPRMQIYESVQQAWSKLVEDDLSNRCRIVDISDKCLKVQVDSASYLYELQLRSSEILEKLRELCPAARLKKMKIFVGNEKN